MITTEEIIEILVYIQNDWAELDDPKFVETLKKLEFEIWRIRSQYDTNQSKKYERSIINESLKKKGGLNNPPTTERPDPPPARPTRKHNKEGKE